ncbi:MAG: TPM domain-containing protein, partial [Chroococcidiopsidaceae cyanobacterium CP_BM_RX_35]|nr:TPM domain-containing protein [Chroococcidiopsidaceae cyanobacterium CP_BM_RX_35]
MKQVLRQMWNWKKYIQRLILPLTLMILTILSLAVPTADATGVYQMPSLNPGDHTWVIDQAEILSRSNEGTLGKKLDNLAEATGNELRFVTIRRLDYGETIESFTKALFEKWFPTPAAQANQALLVIDTLTNGTAIYSGDKVKSLLTDDIANS